jgi:hypothetical protein
MSCGRTVLFVFFALRVAYPQTSEREIAEEQLQQQKRQRMFGIFPNFNASYVSNPAPLSSSQKFRLAFRGAIDPMTFGVSAIDAATSQMSDRFHDYGQGMQGYAKRFGASYADSFNGTMLAGGVFPSLLHQDPRYFRKGTGSFMPRVFYAMSTTFRAKSDKGKWMPNYSNILGNLAAGGISNLYYPASDRGAALTVQRAFVVTAEGAIGSIFVEFWPDISTKFFKHH